MTDLTPGKELPLHTFASPSQFPSARTKPNYLFITHPPHSSSSIFSTSTSASSTLPLLNTALKILLLRSPLSDPRLQVLLLRLWGAASLHQHLTKSTKGVQTCSFLNHSRAWRRVFLSPARRRRAGGGFRLRRGRRTCIFRGRRKPLWRRRRM